MSELKLVKSETKRGFQLIEFKDLYGRECSIQESSLVPVPAIWIGVDISDPPDMKKEVNSRMHLNQNQVKGLLPILQKFADTGEI